MSSVVAPVVPGKLGEAIEPTALRTYLDALTQWIALRRQELDALDAAAMRGGREGDDPTHDVALSMALWQSIVDRERELQRVWNGGRVGPQERLEMSTLLWGRLDAGAGTSAPGMNVSMLEATRLSDAMADSLRTRLGLNVEVTQTQTRLRALVAQLERLRQQVGLEPSATAASAQQQVDHLATRLSDMTAQAERGGDIGGLLGPLELDAATFERDLIVNGNLRRRQASRQEQIEANIVALKASHERAAMAVAQASEQLRPTPKYALPDLSSVDEVPADPQEWPTFEAKLARVSEAVAMVEKANVDAVAALGSLRERLDSMDSTDASARATVEFARSVAGQKPVPVPVLTHLVAAAQAHCDLGGHA